MGQTNEPYYLQSLGGKVIGSLKMFTKGRRQIVLFAYLEYLKVDFC